MPSSTMPLLTPLPLGPFHLSHRVVLAPLTRYRAYDNMPQPHSILYYAQRSTPGGLLISEGTYISETARGYSHAPGIYTREQVEAWKPIVQAVHDKGAFFFLQLWHVGRATSTVYQPNGQAPVSSSNKKLSGKFAIPSEEDIDFSSPRPLRTEEMLNIVEDFRAAARNAMEAGFDGVEIHAAHGYLLDQFLKNGANDRNDEYGGSIENRCRFPLEVVQGLVEEVGADRVGIRLSPFLDYNEVSDSDPCALGLHMANALNRYNILYVHLVDSWMKLSPNHEIKKDDSLVPIRQAFKGICMVAGGYNQEEGNAAIASGKADLVSFGRLFLSNPDLPRRFALNAPLNPYKRKFFYTPDPVVGYTDYPFHEEVEAHHKGLRSLL